jgi:hypothetical protein
MNTTQSRGFRSVLQSRVAYEAEHKINMRPQLKTADNIEQTTVSESSRREKLLIRAAIVMLVSLLGFMLMRGAARNQNLPEGVLGVWVSSVPKYANCSMEITPVTIQFSNADGGFLNYFVTSVEETQQRDRTTYMIHYTDLDGANYETSLVYVPAPHELIYFTHQTNVAWTRRPAS